MTITQAKAMGLCSGPCNFAVKGECKYHQFDSHNYRNIAPGDCFMTDQEAKQMQREYGIIGKGRRK